ncbi:hypothetical protein [[Erwinia] mediterraneensis]|uniref:hypothetical protein n=1 Tax=[Erwinia] mediterraneensis TaxID=2161819 RepID=UPI00102F4806|nr:hypothetical protein [[Erwinia] mediterraneensis]
MPQQQHVPECRYLLCSAAYSYRRTPVEGRGNNIQCQFAMPVCWQFPAGDSAIPYGERLLPTHISHALQQGSAFARPGLFGKEIRQYALYQRMAKDTTQHH